MNAQITKIKAKIKAARAAHNIALVAELETKLKQAQIDHAWGERFPAHPTGPR